MANPNGYYDVDRANRNYNTGAAGTPNAGDVRGTMNHPHSHVGNTAEYMASGYPFIQTVKIASASYTRASDGSTIALEDNDIVKVSFPYVTRWVIVRATSGGSNVSQGDCFIGLTQTGMGISNVPCKIDALFISGVRLEMKLSELYIECADVSGITNVQIIAGLTNIPASDFVIDTALNTNIGVDKAATIGLVLDANE